MYSAVNLYVHVYLVVILCVDTCVSLHSAIPYVRRHVNLDEIAEVLLDFVRDTAKDWALRLPVLAILEQVCT